jgi:hypothetical protein
MKRLFVTIGLALVLAACGDPGQVGSDGGAAATTGSTASPTTTADPDEPVDDGGDQPIVEPGPPGSIPEPRPPIAGNIDGAVYVTSADLRNMESFPIQVMLDVSGDKPTACHEIFWTVEDDGEVIDITMISQIPSDQVCAQVLEPFTVAVPLGSWAEESREVRLNGEVVGSFDS